MVSTITILLVSVLSLYLVWTVFRPGLPQIKSLEDWEAKNHAVDPEMFRVLLDPAEEQYLRQSLPPHEFRALPEKAHGAGPALAGSGGGKCRYVNETGATGEDGSQSSAGQGSGGFDPWRTPASCKLVAGSALFVVEMDFSGLDVIVTRGRNTVQGIAHVSRSDPATTAVGPAAICDGRLRSSGWVNVPVPVVEFLFFPVKSLAVE